MESASGSERLDTHNPGPLERGPWLLVAGFVVLAAIVVALAVVAWREQARTMRATTDRSLNAVAYLRANQITAWLTQRRGDAAVIRSDGLLSAAIGDLLSGHGGPATEAAIAARLAAIQEHYSYVDVTLVRPDGTVVVRQPEEASHDLGAPARALVRKAVRTRQVESTDLYLDAAGHARFDVVAPVLGDQRGDPAVAAVVLHMDPARFLYPLVQGTDARGVEWPLQTTSGEVLLVERRGDEVLYLNELRYRKGAALRLTAPASELDLPAAKAVRGEQGGVEGVDYRGVPVIAGLRPVPGTPWFVVAKVDAREVLGPITRRGWITVGFTLLVVALAAAGALLLWLARESRVTASLLASEIRFRSLFESMAEGVALHELVHAANGAPIDYRILQVNPSSSERMGLAAEKVRGRLASEVYGTPVSPFLDRYAQAVADDEPQQFEAYLEPLGKHFDISVVPQGKGRFATIFEDISERKRAEEELRASERKFRETVEALDEGYYSVSLDGILLDHNPAYCLLQGYDADADLRGQLTPDVWRDPADREAYAAQLQANGAVHNYLARTRARDGADQVLLLNAHLVRDEHGEVTHIDGSSVDFTAHREAADQIERLNAELEQRVRERTAELDAVNKELEAFTYTVSHDLRAPLRHISGFSSLLTKRTGDSLDEKSRHYVDTISSSVREMGVLIDDLLQFSRTGRAELQIEAVDMNAALAEALAPLQHETDGRVIDWSICTLPSAMGDHALLRQVWANLIGNAVKYTRGRTPARIEVGAQAANDEDIFFVRDNGVGFDMQYAHKLFGVFQRLHSASEFEGAGIGLANVQRIVTRLGGRAWAEAEVDQGATFFFSLPRQKERQ